MPSHHLEGWEKKLRALGEIYQDGDYEEIIAEIKAKYENCPQCTGLREEFKADIQQKVKLILKSTCKEGHALPTRYCDSCSEVRANNSVLKDVLALFKNSSK